MKRSSLALTIALLALALCAATSPAANAAAKSCQPANTKTLFTQGTAVVYSRRVKGPGGGYFKNKVYGCSRKYMRSFRLQPDPSGRGDDVSMFTWNGRYLFFTTGYASPADVGSWRLPNLIDLKNGRSSRELHSETQDWQPFDCGAGCSSAVKKVVLGKGRSFVTGGTLSGNQSSRQEVTLYCVSSDFTSITARLVDYELTAAELKTLRHDNMGGATWKSRGMPKSVAFC
jgi:hypothetical protein